MCPPCRKPNSDSRGLQQSKGVFAGAKQEEWAAPCLKGLDAFQARVVKYALRGEGHRMLVDLLLMGQVTG